MTFTDSSSFNWHTLEGKGYLEGELINLDVSSDRLLGAVRDHFERDDLHRIDENFVRELRGELLSSFGAQGFRRLPRLPVDMPSVREGLRDIRLLLTTYYSVEMVILRRTP